MLSEIQLNKNDEVFQFIISDLGVKVLAVETPGVKL